jgi:formylglycine-generating enzyme required for sulfatase activity
MGIEGVGMGVYVVDVDEFQIGKYEVTNRQYAQCVKADICVGSAYAEDRALHPVVDVSWYDAKTYCEWVGGSLPTEAEWEKAASWDDETKTKRMFPWGDSIDCTFANYYGKDDGFGISACVGDTTLVGSYESGKSPYGLYDMAGNLGEWTSSLFQDYPYDANDGREDMSSSDYRVQRGGSWDDTSNDTLSANRTNLDPAFTYYDVGFRCARDVP